MFVSKTVGTFSGDSGSTLAQPFLRRLEENRMGFLQDSRNTVCKGTLRYSLSQNRAIRLAAVFTGKPMVALTEQVVAHFAPLHQVE